ncbi:hypothetical protein A3G67_02860 [Candidatus Roizmanbacteria bacterium RIFCSPLOWO2_12_FULL_40_12]|uniref:Uncharacterized protein n=1 Tax=Candidatus Roizmanbacteria bacterium RIFCSPLOWO2_01_FULL_40_42 TaxID=1802066 RepID=A0A1F7J2P7_9BACT|nr:MAG: hypothetical protein A2779_00390 [Candidatus Roizmanbacteria bacterium RIFCSPHIGHO2_01_FULL_40_98]OGK27518.1 MAG: hypothetical protein A3C31_03545 [Candidatus Roizmanbacteria bacterium RIFCSPHIGHO2_02_FULL_40_53]OGK30274.1 MAG: hypothetical protein A2W49_01030 [Candidatus Roizmanbacteria bacterium RIFCSPHIGHO2_12_41_18]OGK37126.1 MAG: hypothetical protein A3E69_01565 [Candidatus Roizmanbacteria bacterium RIFCSPHIGHO2_12_FULL_40_130]OGK49880.1 MAG: hypothetical protein A3B50_03785 [Candi
MASTPAEGFVMFSRHLKLGHDADPLRKEMDSTNREIAMWNETLPLLVVNNPRSEQLVLEIGRSGGILQRTKAFMTELLQPTEDHSRDVNDAFLLIGAQMTCLEQVEKQTALFGDLANGDHKEQIDRVVELDAFRHSTALFVKLCGVTFREIAEDRGPATIAAFLNFIVEPQLFMQVIGDVTLEEFIGENQDYPAGKYPNITKQGLHLAIVLLLGLDNVDRELMFRESRDLGSRGQAATNALRLIDNLNQRRKETGDILLNPEKAPEKHDELVGVIGRYIAEDDPEERALLCALRNMMLLEEDQIARVYRKTRELANEREGSDIYNKIADRLIKYLKDHPKEFGSFTHPDDAEAIFDASQLDPDRLESLLWEEISKEAQEIIRFSYRKKFDVDPSIISEGLGFSQVGSIQVEFKPQHPRSAYIVIEWKKEDSEESIRFEFELNAKEKKLKWSILDSPDDPNLEENLVALKMACESLAHVALTDIRRQRQEEVASHSQPARIHSTREIQQNDGIPGEKRRKKRLARKKESNGDKGIHEGRPNGNPQPKDKKLIEGADDEESGKIWEGMAKRVTKHVAQVTRAIKRFSEEGVGVLHHYKSGSNGKKDGDLYTLQVQTPGQTVWVILRKHEDEGSEKEEKAEHYSVEDVTPIDKKIHHSKR